MFDKVFFIKGDKINAFIADDQSLKFSGKSFYSADAFRLYWEKSLTLATKIDIKYYSIKSITKEDSSREIKIRYKTWAGLPGECDFTINDDNDYELFFNYLVKQQYFRREYENLSPYKAVKNYVLYLLFTIGITIFFYFEAVDIANGTAEEVSSAKSKLFSYFLGFIGGNGVIVIGVLIAGYLGYLVWKRFSNPPRRLLLTPPQS